MSLCLALHDIVEQLGGTISGDATVVIRRVASLAHADIGAIGFFNDTKYTTQLANTLASAVILREEHAHLTSLPKIVTDNPYAYFAKLSQLLNPQVPLIAGIHPQAAVDSSAQIPPSCSIGAQTVIGKNVRLGERVVVGAGCVIEHDCVIGDDSMLEPHVTLLHGTYIGQRCHLFSGCVIGADGFGYAEEKASSEESRWVKIPQIGRVVIEDDVDVGANTTIDRGAIDDTVVGQGSKIDNLVQIAHNCRIGAHTVIAGCVGIAGSAVIGAHCKIGGAAMILGHLHIADGVTISPGSMITRSIPNSGVYTAIMPFQAHEDWLKTAANIRHLGDLTDRIKRLEAQVQALGGSEHSKKAQK